MEGQMEAVSAGLIQQRAPGSGQLCVARLMFYQLRVLIETRGQSVMGSISVVCKL